MNKEFFIIGATVAVLALLIHVRLCYKNKKNLDQEEKSMSQSQENNNSKRKASTRKGRRHNDEEATGTMANLAEDRQTMPNEYHDHPTSARGTQRGNTER